MMRGGAAPMPNRNPFTEASLVLMLLMMTVLTVMQMCVTDLSGVGAPATYRPGVSSPKDPARAIATQIQVPGWDRFAGVAGQRLIAAMTNRIPTMPRGMVVRFYVGPRGYVRDPRIAVSSGSPAIDHIVEAQLLPGLELAQPPQGLRMPLVMWVSIMRGGWIYSLEPTDQ
jgi:hypothetical protein